MISEHVYISFEDEYQALPFLDYCYSEKIKLTEENGAYRVDSRIVFLYNPKLKDILKGAKITDDYGEEYPLKYLCCGKVVDLDSNLTYKEELYYLWDSGGWSAI